MSGVVVRPAAAGDGAVLLDLVDGLADYEKLPRPTPDARDRLLADGFGGSPRFRVLLAFVDGRPAGYALCFDTYSSFLARPTLYLEDLFVLPDARGRGAGGALFRAVAADAVARGCGRMEWAVLRWNRLAIDFYDGLGARPLDEWQTYRLEGAALAAVGGNEENG
jgi:GNAT superfamily N-acetyltransferase